MRRRLQESRPSASMAGLQAADETCPTLASLFGMHINQPLFLARPAGTPYSAHRGHTWPLPPPEVPPAAAHGPFRAGKHGPLQRQRWQGQPYRLWQTVLLGRTAGWSLVQGHH